MPAAVATSVKAFALGGASDLTSPSWTIGGSDRVVYGISGTGDGAPPNPSGMKWGGSGGTALTQLGSTHTLDGTYWKTALFRLIAPTAQTSTGYASWAASGSTVMLVMVACTGVDQTTPNRTVAEANGVTSAPSANATSVSGDKVLGLCMGADYNGSNHTTASGQTSIEEIEGTDTQYESLAAAQATAAGVSTTMSWTFTGVGASYAWKVFALALIDAAGGGGGTDQPARRRHGGILHTPFKTPRGVRVH